MSKKIEYKTSSCSGWDCIGKDTDIKVEGQENCQVKISQLQEGNRVVSEDGKSYEVMSIITGEEEKILTIKTEKRQISLTESHSIKVEEGWICAMDIRLGMNAVCEQELEQIVMISEEPYSGLVYNVRFREETPMIGNGFIIGDFDMQQRIKPRREWR